MSAMIFLALVPFSSYAVTLPLIREDFGLSNTEAAFLFSSYLVGLAFASLILVPLTDRFPPERILLGGVVALTLSNLLFPYFARGFTSAAILRAGAGAGHVAAYFPGIRLVSRRFAEGRRGSAVATFIGSGYLGTTLSYSVTGAMLARSSSWQGAYLGAAAIGLVAAPIAYGLCRKPQPTERETTGSVALSPLRDRPLALVIVAYALHSAELYLARLWLPLLLGAFLVRHGAASGGAVATAAGLAGAMFTTGVAGVFFGGLVSDRIGRTAAASSLFALSGACSFAVGWLMSWPPSVMIAIGFLYGFTLAADSPIYATAVTELAPPAKLGSAQAVQSFMGFLAGAIAPVAGGVVLDRWSGDSAWSVMFGLNGLLALGGILVLHALRRDPGSIAMAHGKR
jgi:MFS family permease